MPEAWNGGAELAAITWFPHGLSPEWVLGCRAALLSRMKSRMKLVNHVALTMRWHRTDPARRAGGRALNGALGPSSLCPGQWRRSACIQVVSAGLAGPRPLLLLCSPHPILSKPSPTSMHPGSHQNTGQAALRSRVLRLTTETPGELWSVI